MATIQDVARACGVSPATVSYVLNNGPRSVRPQTRERVLEAIERLRYDPSAVARGLRRKRMDTFGVVFPHAHTSLVTNPYFAGLLDGILSVATQRHQNTTLFTGHIWSDERRSLSIYCDGRCDGLLVIAPPLNSDIIPALLQKGLPFVLISDDYDDPTISISDVDNRGAASRLVEYLLEQGHRRIGMLCGPPDAFSAQQRSRGYQDALHYGGVEYDPSMVIYGHYNQESGYDNTQILFREGNSRPTAIFCCSDAIALGCIQMLHEMKLRVPDDISIVGFDDIPAAAVSDPPLTTVRQPLRELGERAAEILLEHITTGKPPQRKEILPVELVIRSSVRAI